MKTITLVAMVAALAKPGQEILDALTPLKCSLLHHAIGIAGENLEIDIACFNDDYENLAEETGDILFYLQGILNDLAKPGQEVAIESYDYANINLGKSVTPSHALEKVIDTIKKYTIYGKDFHPVTLLDAVEEVVGHIHQLLDRYGESIPNVIEANKQKLVLGVNARYPELAYSDEAANARRDKQQ